MEKERKMGYWPEDDDSYLVDNPENPDPEQWWVDISDWFWRRFGGFFSEVTDPKDAAIMLLMALDGMSDKDVDALASLPYVRRGTVRRDAWDSAPAIVYYASDEAALKFEQINGYDFAVQVENITTMMAALRILGEEMSFALFDNDLDKIVELVEPDKTLELSWCIRQLFEDPEEAVFEIQRKARCKLGLDGLG